MNKLILALALVSLALCAVGQDLVPTWEKTVVMQPGDTLDLVAISQTGFSCAWAEIAGQVAINGTVTNFASWCGNSTCKAVAITSATLKISGN